MCDDVVLHTVDAKPDINVVAQNTLMKVHQHFKEMFFQECYRRGPKYLKKQQKIDKWINNRPIEWWQNIENVSQYCDWITTNMISYLERFKYVEDKDLGIVPATYFQFLVQTMIKNPETSFTTLSNLAAWIVKCRDDDIRKKAEEKYQSHVIKMFEKSE